MDYRFEISLPTSSDFRCEIAVGGEQTFQQFHDKIVETLNYDSSQMASFFTLDRMGNRVKEIALMDMTTEDEENETLVMDNTKISDIIKPGCLELEYVYDFFSNKYFKVEYEGDYDDSFMEEFGNGDYDDEDRQDRGGDDEYYRDERYESLDDYIDRL